MRSAFALIAVSALAVSACKTGLDHEKLEAAIKTEADKHDWPVKEISCPSGKAATAGDKFKCKVTFKDDQNLDIDVTVEDSAGNVKFKSKKVTPIAKVQKNIGAAVAKKVGHDVEIDCEHHKVLILDDGEEITCGLESEKHDGAKIVISVTDDEGNVKWKIKE